MSSPNRNNRFLSQRIQCSSTPPLLIPPTAKNLPRATTNLKPLALYDEETKENLNWQWKIEASLIPSLNIYYMLEPTSITLKQTPLPMVESRMADFLRLQSIAYSYDAQAVRLDCVTSSMLKFVVQFWRVGGGPNNESLQDPNQALIVELQRRQGSTIEMHDIRKAMFRALLTGEQPSIPADEKPRQPPLPDVIMAEVDEGYDHEAGRADAFEICLRLLESRCIDQGRLGLESLKMLTEPSIVSRRDAIVASRAIAFQEGCYGERLQTALAGYIAGEATTATTQHEYEDSLGHGMTLAILANALQLVLEDKVAGNEQPAAEFNMTSGFWALVAQDLFHCVERAAAMPHEAAKSAKCIRLLNDLQSRVSNAHMVPTIRQAGLRSCVADAHKYGQRFHLSLERESQKLLAMDTDSFLRVH